MDKMDKEVIIPLNDLKKIINAIDSERVTSDNLGITITDKEVILVQHFQYAELLQSNYTLKIKQ